MTLALQTASKAQQERPANGGAKHERPRAAKAQRKWLAIAIFCVACIAVLCVSWFGFFNGLDDGLALLYKEGFLLIVALIEFAFWVFRRQLLTHPENVFLVIVLSLTCGSSWVYDTNEVSWDVESHYAFMLDFANFGADYHFTEADESIVLRELEVSPDDQNKALLDEYEAEQDEPSSHYRNALGEDAPLMEEYPSRRVMANLEIWTNTDALQAKDTLLNELDDVPGDENKVSKPFSLMELYNRLASLPASLVFFLVSLFGVPFTLKYVIAKMVYAVIYSLVLYFGMKQLRSGKMIYACVALLPTCVFLAANYNYDYWVICWTMYAVASIVGTIQWTNRKVSNARLVKILAAFFIGLSPKAIYFPLILLCLLIPKGRFASRRQMICFRIASIACMLVVMALIVVSTLTPSAMAGDQRGGSEVNAKEQMLFILSHPLRYAKYLFLFLLDYLSLEASQDYTVLASYLGYGPMVAWVCVLVALLYATVTDTRFDNRQLNNWKTRCFAVLIFGGTVCLVATALYVSFTNVGLDEIKGVQGRYLIPLIFPLLVFLSGRRACWPRGAQARRVSNGVVLGVMAFANLSVIWSQYLGVLT